MSLYIQIDQAVSAGRLWFLSLYSPLVVLNYESCSRRPFQMIIDK